MANYSRKVFPYDLNLSHNTFVADGRTTHRANNALQHSCGASETRLGYSCKHYYRYKPLALRPLCDRHQILNTPLRILT